VNRLTIGVDIDGVIVDIARAWLPLLSEVCGRPVSAKDLCSWDLGAALGISEEQVNRVWLQTLGTDLLRHAPAIKGAIDGLASLARHEVWLVTARPASMAELTRFWLADNGARYQHLVHERFGNKLWAGGGFDVFIEDYLEEARVIAEAGVPSILFDQPWNRGGELPPNCTRVTDWHGVVALIDALGRQ